MDPTTDVSTRATEASPTTDIPFRPYGLPGVEFDVVHGLSVCTLTTSILISTGVLIHLRPGKGFSSWPIGDRIVVYIALSDEIYSWNVISDQIVMWATRDFVPDVPCAVFAFFQFLGIVSQALIVVFAALNAFAMVVYRRRLHTGRSDWRLLGMAYGGPALIGTVGAASGYFGASEAWCLIDLRKPHGYLLNTVVVIVMLLTLIFSSVCYVGVWLTIRRAAKLATTNKKYHRTARVMMVFVAAYILQWWAAVLYGMWGLFAKPPLAVILSTLVFATLGGLWNFIAYTLVRRKGQKVQGEDGTEMSRTTNNTRVETIGTKTVPEN